MLLYLFLSSSWSVSDLGLFQALSLFTVKQEKLCLKHFQVKTSGRDVQARGPSAPGARDGWDTARAHVYELLGDKRAGDMAVGDGSQALSEWPIRDVQESRMGPFSWQRLTRIPGPPACASEGKICA